ncbi:hypothetical protein ACGFNU_29465 [Spirillospora sp. NPDC048911]|uniref:hypothetical protein n=1 Tax=Spirillospora sp. NPDC048911 TaxID=3364527 RepID=UPI00370FDADF
MGGTALSVLSPYAAERVEPIAVAEMVAEGLARSASDPGSWYSADGLPYGYGVQAPDAETEPEQLQSLERAAGVTMSSDVVFHIFVNDRSGRPALARMAQRVARRVEGWVFVEFSEPPSAELLGQLAAAGRCVDVGGAVFLDAAAMTAWNVHPEFHVVK